MTLIFFQNCISPHQLPYIQELPSFNIIDKVYVIAPRINYEDRESMGWNSSNYLKNEQITFYIYPNKNTIIELLCKKNIICLFSGIRADQDVFTWFKISLQYDVKRYIITEPPYVYDKPLWMHYIRFFIQDYKYINYIDGIFAIGELAMKYYHNISNKWKIFPFQYVTKSIPRSLPCVSGKPQLLFVGSLTPRKNVNIVLEALKGNQSIDFNIVGNGVKRSLLEQQAIKNHVNANFLGSQPMNKIPIIMQQNDILILPSLHDGWGAVVNEAMTLGLYIIISDRCGAKALITNKLKGEVYPYKNVNKLKEILEYATKHIDEIRKGTFKRIEEAQGIQGKAISKYFINCLFEK